MKSMRPKLLASLLALFMLGVPAVLVCAANTPPPCTSGALITNGGNGQYGCNLVGPGLAVVTSGSALYLTVTNQVPSAAIIEENGSPIITENGVYIVEE